MKLRLWPGSLASRTAVVLLLGLMAVQIAGLTIHAFDRIEVQRFSQVRDVAIRMAGMYRAIVLASPAQRDAVLAEFNRGLDIGAEVTSLPPVLDLPEAPDPVQRLFRYNMFMGGPPPGTGGPPVRRRELQIFGGPGDRRFVAMAHLSDGMWLTLRARVDAPRPWHSPGFMAAFALMTVVAAGLTIWAVRRLTAPVATLAAAAEALGRDVNAAPLPEDGPREVATAAAAFNTMAGRIRRFVQDRTELLTAIGHDLRTPITRLKLRAEFVDDDELRTKMLADLEELEAMVAATLAFGRDARTTEPVTSIDLAELLRTILDEAGDANPEQAERLSYDGPAHATVRARSLSLKRALTNLVSNAIAYGGAARVRLAVDGGASVTIDDDGPGIPPSELDRVFEPFQRGEGSRNRETGGVGLGLPIARNILRAHGGDVTLANRAGGGARAVATLPMG